MKYRNYKWNSPKFPFIFSYYQELVDKTNDYFIDFRDPKLKGYQGFFAP